MRLCLGCFSGETVIRIGHLPAAQAAGRRAGSVTRGQESHCGALQLRPRASMSCVTDLIRVCSTWKSSVEKRPAAAGPSLPMSSMMKLIRCCRRGCSARYAGWVERHCCKVPRSVVQMDVWDSTDLIAASFWVFFWSGDWVRMSGEVSYAGPQTPWVEWRSMSCLS